MRAAPPADEAVGATRGGTHHQHRVEILLTGAPPQSYHDSGLSHRGQHQRLRGRTDTGSRRGGPHPMQSLPHALRGLQQRQLRHRVHPPSCSVSRRACCSTAVWSIPASTELRDKRSTYSALGNGRSELVAPVTEQPCGRCQHGTRIRGDHRSQGQPRGSARRTPATAQRRMSEGGAMILRCRCA